MKVKELIEELQKCNPDAKVEINTSLRGKDELEYITVHVGNPASCACTVEIFAE